MHEHNRLIDYNWDGFLDFLRELITFPSVRADALPEKPFGEGVDACYRYMLERAKADGFEVFDADGWGGHAQWRGLQFDENGTPTAASETLGIPVHLDVVPEGDGWSHPPYAAEMQDGRIYGRGASDNKGAVAAVYYALLALKESGFVPSKNIRLIFGLDEETGWSGMKKYFEKAPAPDFGFVPDAEFPAIHGEKGIMDFQIAKKLTSSREKGLVLTNLTGGNASNMVPDAATAILTNEKSSGFESVKATLTEYRMKTGYNIRGRGIGKAFKIEATGVSAHGSRPENGKNAISILMALLGEIGIANESVREFIDFYNDYVGFENDGKALGIQFSDEPSGPLTLNCGLVEMDKEAAILTFNVRHPVTMKEDVVYEALLPLIHKLDVGLVKLDYKAPIYVPASDPFIQTLMRVYRNITKDEESKPIVIGGGTYARAIPNAVAFGPMFPNEPDCMHQADEYVDLNHIRKAMHIYADAIYELTGGKENA
ncbi:MAG: dipeptidase PepV [Clostridiales Family XIII bacterium]|jgi:succinyl-diaminopimelate desuccinylase|nr:dipeptidase PepV [Clostridiales Family XIII bacterium]